METDKALISDPSKEKVNLAEYVAVSHSLLGLCFAKGRTPVHERVAYFLFVTTATIGVSMWAAIKFPNGGWYADLWAIAISIAVVTPATFVYKCSMGCLNDMKCLLEILTLLFVTYTVYWAAREPQARGAAQVGLLALGAEWVAEVPSLVFKYFFCATVCPCCMPKKDSVNSVSDIVGGAPSCHIDMER